MDLYIYFCSKDSFHPILVAFNPILVPKPHHMMTPGPPGPPGPPGTPAPPRPTFCCRHWKPWAPAWMQQLSRVPWRVQAGDGVRGNRWLDRCCLILIMWPLDVVQNVQIQFDSCFQSARSHICHISSPTTTPTDFCVFGIKSHGMALMAWVFCRFLGSTGALLRSPASDPSRLARLLPKVPLGERRKAMLLARLYECVASAQKQVGKAGEGEENHGLKFFLEHTVWNNERKTWRFLKLFVVCVFLRSDLCTDCSRNPDFVQGKVDRQVVPLKTVAPRAAKLLTLDGNFTELRTSPLSSWLPTGSHGPLKLIEKHVPSSFHMYIKYYMVNINIYIYFI